MIFGNLLLRFVFLFVSVNRMMDEDETSLVEVAADNYEHFVSAYSSYQDVKTFLHRRDDSSVLYRPVSTKRYESTLMFSYDFDTDGIVIELDRISCVQFYTPYVNLLPQDKASLIPMYPVLKKHVFLSEYSKEAMKLLRWTSGMQLISEHGWQINAVLMPNKDLSSKNRFRDIHHFRNRQLLYFKKVRECFQNELQKIASIGPMNSTINKNVLNDLRKLRILPDDQMLIMECLDRSFAQTELPEDLFLQIFAFRFGERCSFLYNLDDDFDRNTLKEISVHCGVNISCKYPEIHLFWSREGLQSLVGNRGQIKNVFSFRDCCTFQSNLDGRAIDISDTLRNICIEPEGVTFLQCYSDVPHLRPSSLHPVSGIIGTCGLLNKHTLHCMNRQADTYINYARENASKLNGLIEARLEFVCRLRIPFCDINPRRILSVRKLRNLLNDYPMILPFTEARVNTGVKISSCLQNVAIHIVNYLAELKQSATYKGGFRVTWEAYQYELANEMFWYGSTYSWLDRINSVNLGIGISSESRSLTNVTGFLCFDGWNVCACSEQSTPPLRHWTKSAEEQIRIRNLFSFSDFLESSPSCLGKRCMLVLCQDLINNVFKDNESPRSLMSDLRCKELPIWARQNGSMDAHVICQELGVSSKFKKIYAFGRALEIMKESNIDVETVLYHGMRSMQFNFFPSMSHWDRNRNRFTEWNGKDVVRLVFLDDRDNTRPNRDKVLVTSLIVSDLEIKNLVHKSKFQKSGNIPFPWIHDILQRLDHLHMTASEELDILTFTSCIALLQNGWYVNYKNLAKLGSHLPISQSFLQRLEVLSCFRIQGLVGMTLFRLHEEISFRYSEEKTREIYTDDASETGDDDPGIEIEHEEIVAQEDVERLPLVHHNARHKASWSTEEENVLLKIINDNHMKHASAEKREWKTLYKTYVMMCAEQMIPDRTFHAFRAACLRRIKD